MRSTSCTFSAPTWISIMQFKRIPTGSEKISKNLEKSDCSNFSSYV
jgi:hypothetical protein